MKMRPLGTHMVGRVVDIIQTKGGLELPDGEIKGVSIFVLVDVVGPDVTKVKKGDVVLPKHGDHAWFRDGTHYLIVDEQNVRCVVEDLDPRQLAVEGERRVDGKPASLVALT